MWQPWYTHINQSGIHFVCSPFAIVPPMPMPMPMFIVLLSGWWPCFHARKTSIACLPHFFFFCATMNSLDLKTKLTKFPAQDTKHSSNNGNIMRSKSYWWWWWSAVQPSNVMALIVWEPFGFGLFSENVRQHANFQMSKL